MDAKPEIKPLNLMLFEDEDELNFGDKKLEGGMTEG